MKARTQAQLQNRNTAQILIYKFCIKEGVSTSMERISELFRQLNIQGRKYIVIKKLILQELVKSNG